MTLLLTFLTGALCAATGDELDRYVARPDESYTWSILHEARTRAGIPYAELRMTSQTWKGTPWRHRMLVLRPADAVPNSPAILLIGGGSWSNRDEARPLDQEAREFGWASEMVRTTGMPVAVLLNVPFQPMFGDMHEDQLIAHTFQRFMETGDAEWPLLLPMTKAAVRGMDTVQALALRSWKTEVPAFVVTGASKRGWTTWLTAAADKRVKGIAPIVFDTLRLPEQMKHQIVSWGDYQQADRRLHRTPSPRASANGTWTSTHRHRGPVQLSREADHAQAPDHGHQ